MAELIRSVVRYIPSYGLYALPTYRKMTVSLVRYSLAICIQTPWSCFPGTEDMTEDDLIRFARNSFATPEEAEAEARRLCPFAGKPRNEEVRDELIRYRQWEGDIVGPARVADAYGVSTDEIYKIAHGAIKAPKKIAPIKQTRI